MNNASVYRYRNPGRYEGLTIPQLWAVMMVEDYGGDEEYFDGDRPISVVECTDSPDDLCAYEDMVRATIDHYKLHDLKEGDVSDAIACLAMVAYFVVYQDDNGFWHVYEYETCEELDNDLALLAETAG